MIAFLPSNYHLFTIHMDGNSKGRAHSQENFLSLWFYPDDWHRPALLGTIVHVRTAWGGGRWKGWVYGPNILRQLRMPWVREAVLR
jgi:hypothetical protein